MARYTDVECDKCGEVYPSNQMHKVTDRVESGETVTPYRENGNTRTNTKKHYSNVVRRLCPECFKSRKRWGCLQALALIAVPGVLLGLPAISSLVQSGAIPKNDLTSRLSSAGQKLGTAESSLFEKRLSTASTKSLPVNAVTEPAEKTDEEGGEVRADSGSQSSEAIDQTSSAEAREAVSTAATSGKATKWRNDVSKGYAIPSSANEVGCRNVYITDKKMGKNWQSPVETVCP